MRVHLTIAAACVACLALSASAYAGPGSQVVVPRGQPLQIAFVNDLTGVVSSYGPSLANAVRLAVGFHPTIRGFRIQINTYDNGCGDPSKSVAAAQAIVANTQNAGVIGHLCSFGFDQALPIYDAAGIVTISGSATNPALAALGTSIFNRVYIPDQAGSDAWFAAIEALPSDLAWQWVYSVVFGAPAVPFADFYYDATSLLLSDLKRVSHVDRSGALVIDRAALARAVRSTRHYEGVTCTITLDPATGDRINDPAALARCAGGTDGADS